MTDSRSSLHHCPWRSHRFAPLAVSLIALMAGAAPQAFAQQVGQSAPSTLSMLNAMVKNGVVTREQADKILNEAAAEDAARGVPAGRSVEAPLPAGTKRVTYVPETVKDQIRDEVKQQVMAQAKNEGWATPNQVPEWTQRIKFSGDIRGRYDGTSFPKGNITGYDVADAWDFNAINTGKPIDVSATTVANDRYRNVDQNRDRMRLRARLGVDADIGEGFSSGIRLATGSGSDPVSTNQSLGGSGGNFSKYQVWLDRAFIHWDGMKDEDKALGINVGRFNNPFFATDLIWDGDLGFDGVAATGRYQVAKGVTPFVTVGAFPVYNTDFNLSSDQPNKENSHDKWLFGAQAGTDWKPSQDVGVKLGVAYYYFSNIEGKESSPCALWDSSVACDTDSFRPSFAQKGNTYMSLRTEAAGRTTADTSTYQYFGLATPFRELALTGRFDYDGLKPQGYRPLRVSVDGEFVKNLGFNKKRLDELAWNNVVCDSSGTCSYEGGDSGYLARVTVGMSKLAERWDWQANLAYKYVESDAVVDGLTDSDFGLGGTNLKGFIFGADMALAPNVWTSFRWMSADNISGATFSVDTVLLDLTARF